LFLQNQQVPHRFRLLPKFLPVPLHHQHGRFGHSSSDSRHQPKAIAVAMMMASTSFTGVTSASGELGFYRDPHRRLPGP